MSISSNTLFTLLSMTFSLTYSFDVLIEATVDVASPCIMLNLQSSALAATRPFGSQPLTVAVVEGAGSSFSQKDALALSLPPFAPSPPLPLRRRRLPLPACSRPYGQRRACRRPLYGLATGRRCPYDLVASKQPLAVWPLEAGGASARRQPSCWRHARSQPPAYELLLLRVAAPCRGPGRSRSCPRVAAAPTGDRPL
ncbi:hypothetical protein GW17_00050201 [Ensete ventricosum]|nr:hypothetical protein GW17_00050201 [Ensete ventricosum]